VSALVLIGFAAAFSFIAVSRFGGKRPDEKSEVRTNRTNTFSVERHMGSLFADTRYAVRLLIRKPGFAAVAILTLALGIGATTAIFTVVHAVLLRPLPFPEAGRLVEGHRQQSAGRRRRRSFAAAPGVEDVGRVHVLQRQGHELGASSPRLPPADVAGRWSATGCSAKGITQR
jgi:hypothetical protein